MISFMLALSLAKVATITFFMKKPNLFAPIDAAVQIRLDVLEFLIDSEYGGSPSKFEEQTEIRMAQVNQWFSGYRALRDKAVKRLEERTGKPKGYFDMPDLKVVEGNGDVVIRRFDTRWSVGNDLRVLDQPGTIKSWHVDDEWLRVNVKHHTGATNLCIVTGFGDSMLGMFNPGDPLLVDRGVTSCNFDGVYFFRVGNEGFIKRLQRIPGEGVLVISENTKYRDWKIKPDMDFEVLAKVLKVWKSE